MSSPSLPTAEEAKVAEASQEELNRGIAYYEPSEADRTVEVYLTARCPQYKRLVSVQPEAWKNEDIDRHPYVEEPRTKEIHKRLLARYSKVLENVQELHIALKCLSVDGRTCMNPDMLAFSAAAGGLLQNVLASNLKLRALAVVVADPRREYATLLSTHPRASWKSADFTQLGSELGIDLPDPEEERSRIIPEDQVFDMVACNWRIAVDDSATTVEKLRKQYITTLAQLILGVSHVRPGGRMILTMNHADRWRSVQIMASLAEFSSVTLYKPQRHFQAWPSFFVVARDVQPGSDAAATAVEKWRSMWKSARYDSDRDFEIMLEAEGRHVDAVLGQFGQSLIELGRDAWRIQADALAGTEDADALITDTAS